VVSLRLASVNLFSGRSLADGRADPDRIAAAVASLDADVLALQEVDRHQPRSAGIDQAALVAEAVGAVAHRFVPLVLGTPGVPGWVPGPRHDDAADERPGPSYGVALVSRRSVSSWHVLHLDPPPGRWPLAIPSRPPRLIWLSDEPRAAVAAVLARPRLTVACTHLSFVPGVNVVQLRRLRRWLEQLPGPRVLLGDLNLPGRLPARLTGWTSLVSAATFPASTPRAQVDHALGADPVDVVPGSGRAVRLPISDHRALVVDLADPSLP
jgi:endonuclease/exonuclease/phosphatase family metal-dependent hydrolase